MNTFNFVARISSIKDTEKFHPIDRRAFKTGWETLTVRFNCISGTNRVIAMTQGGKWQNDSKNVIKTFSKSVTDENGKVIKGSSIEIPWAKRFDEDQINKVAGFKKFTCDTGDVKMRYKLLDLVKAFNDKSVTDEMMEEIGVYNLNDAKAALEKSMAKKKVFLSEWDFAEYMVKVIESDKFKNKQFYIGGNYEVSYNADKDRFYTNYHVNKVVLAPDDVAPSTEMKIDFYFGENAWDDSQYEETGKCLINGWISYYDNTLKKNGFKDISIAVREDEKKVEGLKRKFVVDEHIKQIGLILKVIEGSEYVELTMDMLDEETREDIEYGLISFEDVKRRRGSRVMSKDKVSELRYDGLMENKNKAQDTTYIVEDMHAARVEVAKNSLFDDDDDDDLDLFDDDL